MYATKDNDAFRYMQDEVKGERELLPVEKWFFAQQFKNPGFYNQSVLLHFKRTIKISSLETAFNTIIKHHDGLRLNYNADSGKMFYNGAHLENRFSIEIISDEKPGITESTFDITKDLLLRCVVCAKAGGGDLLLITAHHLVMDGISWRVLLKDLYEIYTGLEQGEDMAPLRKTASSLDWANNLSKYALDNEFPAEEDYWNKTEHVTFAIPEDFEMPDWRYKNLANCTLTFPRETTSLLLLQGNKIFKSDIGLIVSGALAWAIGQWSGAAMVRIELENHGRHLGRVDVSRTTGWFTVLHPVLIQIKTGTVDNFLRSVKDQLSDIPNNGMGYTASRSHSKKLTDIRFNYLGQFNGELNNELFDYVRKDLVTESDPDNHMTAKLELNAMVINGELLIDLLYNTTAHKKTTINQLTELIRTFIQDVTRYLEKQKEVQFSSSAFSGVLDEDELNSLFQ
jgi:non-ribosomal peptide synthase protein (TIGR01720 family)